MEVLLLSMCLHILRQDWCSDCWLLWLIEILCYCVVLHLCMYVASDSDDNDVPARATTKPSADVSASSNFPSKLHGARIVKYNFLDLSKPDVFVLVNVIS